jgi:transcriptional regulator with XRE-family HTH domain
MTTLREMRDCLWYCVQTITKGAKELAAESRERGVQATAELLGVSVATLYRWCNGSALPPAAQRDKILGELEIATAAWTVVLGDDGEPAPPAAGPAAHNDTPSPLQLWRDAHAWRLDVQRRASTASAVSAAFKNEQSALQLVTGDAQRYADMQRITAEVLKAWPDALAALQVALAEADL